MNIRIPFVSLLVLGLFFQCSQTKQAEQPSTIYKEFMPAEALTVINEHKENSNFVLLDVRTPDEFASGHIAGAVVLNFRDPAFADSLQKLDKSKIYMVYCRSGNRSSQAVAQMKAMHFRTIYHINGGMNQWQAAGLPVVQ